MRKYAFTPIDLGEKMEAGKDDFDAATETMTTIMPLLYQSGYFTIKDYDEDTELYTLALPNKEIRVGVYKSLLPHYLASKTVGYIKGQDKLIIVNPCQGKIEKVDKYDFYGNTFFRLTK